MFVPGLCYTVLLGSSHSLFGQNSFTFNEGITEIINHTSISKNKSTWFVCFTNFLLLVYKVAMSVANFGA